MLVGAGRFLQRLHVVARFGRALGKRVIAAHFSARTVSVIAGRSRSSVYRVHRESPHGVR